MPHQVVVRLKDQSEIYGPDSDKETAKAELNKIKNVLSTGNDPGLDWIAVEGRAVLSAHTIETKSDGGGGVYSYTD